MEEVKETGTGKVITGLALAAAVLIGMNHYKEKSFWVGVGAMLLVGLSVKTYSKK